MLKKIVLLAFLCIPLGMMAQEVKIAHVNSMEIFSIMPETAAAETEMANFSQSLRDEFRRMEEEYAKKYTEFMQQQDTLVESIKVRRMTEVQDLQSRLETFAQQADQDIAKKNNDVRAPIIQKIQDAVKAVGEEQGYTYIMEMGAFIFISPKAVDATPLVKTKLGLK